VKMVLYYRCAVIAVDWKSCGKSIVDAQGKKVAADEEWRVAC